MQIFVIWAESSWQLTIMSFLQNSGTQGQNMRPNRLSNIYKKSSMNTVLFVNATIGFSENLFLVVNATIGFSS